LKWAGAGAAAAVVLIGAAVWAASPSASPPPTVAAGPKAAPHPLTMDQAVRMAERRYKARVVRVESIKRGGRTVYVLRLLDQRGRVFTVRIDASSGRIL
jgi:hypothetical protein